MSGELSPGFADPVADAQACFRAVLDAMARPGEVHTVSGVTAPDPLCNASAAVLLTLIDQETPLFLDPDAASAAQWIAFHTGAATVPPADAAFAMGLSLADLTDFSAGSDESPETSATLIVQVESLSAGRRYMLQGPGLREARLLEVSGLPAGFAAIWQSNHSLYPRGIDLILCAGNQLTALPRGVMIREA